ncbi:MAG: TetR family transcriptional regulator [Deltaproteobacteria bacterium]|nr:TetR family transcriptional regulator [Deltaproteobacteria bacterium]
MEIAVSLFLEKGYAATSTADICKAAKINKPTLYNFFENKRNLFFSCHMRSLEYHLQPFLERAYSIENPSDRIKFMIQEFTRIICQHPELKVLIHETMSINDEYFGKVRQIWKRHYELLRDTISKLKEEGLVLTDMPSSRAALFMLGTMTWITFWFNYEKKDSADELAKSAFSFFLNGLSADKTLLLSK